MHCSDGVLSMWNAVCCIGCFYLISKPGTLLLDHCDLHSNLWPALMWLIVTYQVKTNTSLGYNVWLVLMSVTKQLYEVLAVIQVFTVVFTYLIYVEQIMPSRITGTQRCVASTKVMATNSWRKSATVVVRLALFRCWSSRLKLTYINQLNSSNFFQHQPLYDVIFYRIKCLIVYHALLCTVHLYYFAKISIAEVQIFN